MDLLTEQGHIDEEDDLIVGFLNNWLRCVRGKCEDEGTQQRPEFVVTVPSAWSVRSRSRWVKAFEKAIRNLWPAHKAGHQSLIYTIAEPAAAGSYYLWRKHQELRVSMSQSR